MRLVNQTAFPVVFRTERGDVVIPPCGSVATVTYQAKRTQNYPGVPVPIEIKGSPEVNFLFPASPETIIIVSHNVFLAAKDRADLVYPGVLAEDKPIRDATGRVIAITCLRAGC